MTPIRNSSRSSSSVGAPMRPSRPAAGLPLLLMMLALVAADVCTVGVVNMYSQALNLYSFDGDDGVCWSTYDQIMVDELSNATMQCNSNSACKLKLAGESDDDHPSDSCYGTVLVPCGGYLEFYFGPGHEYDYLVNNGRRSRSLTIMELEATDEEEDGVKEDTARFSGSSSSSSSSSRLRGGAKGSKRIL